MQTINVLRNIITALGLSGFAFYPITTYLSRLSARETDVKRKNLMLRYNLTVVLVWFFSMFSFAVLEIIKLPIDPNDPYGELFGTAYIILPAVFAALMFYTLRRELPFIYGIIEVGCGVASVFLSTLSGSGLLAKILAVFGGIYIMVRGFENISKQPPLWAQRIWHM